jgi:hypothetical protein
MWYALLIIIIIFAGLIGYRYYDKPEPSLDSMTPIVTEVAPEQIERTGYNEIAYKIGNNTITIKPIASYKIAGKILAKKKYGSTWSAKLAPYDLALGWGKLTNDEYIEKLKISQWGRFYFFKYEYNLPFREDYIIEHSSNNHIIPATENLRKLLFHLDPGQLIEMEGFLVDVSGKIGKNQVKWNSSIKRDDTGNGSCELVYVRKIKYENKIYE